MEELSKISIDKIAVAFGEINDFASGLMDEKIGAATEL
jgi:hypothetical protein